MLLTLSGRSFIKIQYTSFPLFPVAYPFRIATQLQYYVKHDKCKVNHVIFPSDCEARALNLGSKNMKIGIFTGGTSVRSKNTDISPTGKHEIKKDFIPMQYLCKYSFDVHLEIIFDIFLNFLKREVIILFL